MPGTVPDPKETTVNRTGRIPALNILRGETAVNGERKKEGKREGRDGGKKGRRMEAGRNRRRKGKKGRREEGRDRRREGRKISGIDPCYKEDNIS